MPTTLLLTFVRRDFAERYYGSSLGWLWAFAFPLVMIAIFTIVFGNVLGTRLAGSSSPYDYGIFLVSGIVPWNTFAQTTTRLSNVFVDRKTVLTKIHLPLSFFGVVTAASESITFIISFLMLFGFMLILHRSITLNVVWLVLMLILLQGISYGVGMLVGTFSLFIRDIRELVPVVLQILFWMTPIIYPVTVLPAPIRDVENFNPVFVLVNEFRAVVVDGRPPDILATAKLVAIMVGLVIVVQYTLRVLERHVRDLL